MHGLLQLERLLAPLGALAPLEHRRSALKGQIGGGPGTRRRPRPPCRPGAACSGGSTKAVAYLRSVIGGAVDDPRPTELIGELSPHSERFRTLWARQDVRKKTSGVTRLLHPQIGTSISTTRNRHCPAHPGRCSSPTTPSAAPPPTRGSGCSRT
ncbi:MmyB family transcriptional regulator [Streptosporangium lutulentum]|uniref:MmyB family transcriptional regulator n=1 Tax=Streptosporangium lutulentum TaxID=1461250 RepID=UPI00352205F2